MPSVNGRAFTEQIREVIYAFWDKEKGELRERPILLFLGRNISAERKLLLQRITLLFMTTEFICDAGAREYLASKGETYNEVADRMNLNSDTIRKRVFYYCSVSDKKCGKVVEKFGDMFLTEILNYPNHDISKIEIAVNNELIKYLGLTDLQKNIEVDIPHKRGCSYIDDNEFEDFINIIKPYITKIKEQNRGKITDRQAGYFWYLINNQYCLKDTDAERFNTLKEMIND